MGSTLELNEQNFEQTVSAEGVVLVDLWAPWCGPCRSFKPVFEAAAEKFEGVTFAKVNTEAEPGLASALQIQSIPTLMIFKDGVLVFRQPGALPAAALDDLVNQAAGLDMVEVRKKMAEDEAAKAAPAVQ